MDEPIQITTLVDHRNNLLNNPNRYIQDKERAIKQFAKTSYKFYGSCGKNKKMLISWGIEYVLKFKDEIREFSIKELSCNNNLQIFDKIKEELNNSLKDEVKIIEVIFDIINNSTNLRKQDYEVIQEFILTVVLILEKLQQLLS